MNWQSAAIKVWTFLETVYAVGILGLFIALVALLPFAGGWLLAEHIYGPKEIRVVVVRSDTVPRTAVTIGHPSGATALCNDGTYSYSLSRRGTCSWHGGVALWLH